MNKKSYKFLINLVLLILISTSFVLAQDEPIIVKESVSASNTHNNTTLNIADSILIENIIYKAAYHEIVQAFRKCNEKAAIKKYLKEFGVDINITSSNGQIIFPLAFISDNPSPKDETKKQKKQIDLFIKLGGDINHVDTLGRTIWMNYYPEPEASFMLKNRVDSEKLLAHLIKKGYDINIRDKKGETVLTKAKKYGFKKETALLIKHGAKE